MSVIATASEADLDVLFVLIAVVAFCVAVYCAYLGRIPAAGAAALVGVLVLLFGTG